MEDGGGTDHGHHHLLPNALAPDRQRLARPSPAGCPSAHLLPLRPFSPACLPPLHGPLACWISATRALPLTTPVPLSSSATTTTQASRSALADFSLRQQACPPSSSPSRHRICQGPCVRFHSSLPLPPDAAHATHVALRTMPYARPPNPLFHLPPARQLRRHVGPTRLPTSP